MYEGEIKNLISMEQFCDRYGVEAVKGFVLCPFHNDSSPSCKIYPGNRGFHCFSCGASGDVLDFAQQYFSLSKFDAVKKLNCDFGLHLPLYDYDREAAEKQFLEQRRKQEQKRRKQQQVTERYWALFDTLEGIELVLSTFKPISPDIAPSPLFTRALQEHDHIEAELAFAYNDLRRINDN